MLGTSPAVLAPRWQQRLRALEGRGLASELDFWAESCLGWNPAPERRLTLECEGRVLLGGRF